MTENEMITQLQIEVKGLSTYLEAVDYTSATDDASRDTGWSFPISSAFKIYWQKQRAKRHLFFYLLTESAHKYKVKEFRLDQRFDHYRNLIEYMDDEFINIQNSRPEEFSNVDAYQAFGTYVHSGYQYNDLGKETTYNAENLVGISPDENE